MVPRDPKNNAISRGKDHEEGNRNQNKNHLRKLYREKYREISKSSPGIPEKAIIAHTRIQKDSNFASLRGLNSHLKSVIFELT